MIRYLYNLLSNHPVKSSTHLTPYTVITILLTIKHILKCTIWCVDIGMNFSNHQQSPDNDHNCHHYIYLIFYYNIVLSTFPGDHWFIFLYHTFLCIFLNLYHWKPTLFVVVFWFPLCFIIGLWRFINGIIYSSFFFPEQYSYFGIYRF